MANTAGAEISKINLAPFCSTDKTRAVIMAPFRIGEWTYATNGRIIIRVASSDYPAEVKEKAPLCDSIFKWAHNELEPEFWMALDSLPKIETETLECEDCGGEGVYECTECGQQAECGNCDAGSIAKFYPPEVMAGQWKLNSFYVVKIRDNLANVQLWMHPKEDKSGPVQFRFNGGLGYLMPMRQPGKVD